MSRATDRERAVRAEVIPHGAILLSHEDPPGIVSFTVYGKPQPAGSKRGFYAGGRVIVTDANANSRPWKALVSDAALKEIGGRGPLYRGPLSLSLMFYMPRPKGHFGRRGLLPSAPEHPAVKPDVTKLIRAVEDAMTGIVWKDDTQVVIQQAQKQYGEPARCEVIVHPLTKGAML